MKLEHQEVIDFAKKLEKRRTTNKGLRKFNAEIFVLMEAGVPLRHIAKSLWEVEGVKVSVTTLANFMRSRYPVEYEQNYTSRAPNTKKRSTHEPAAETDSVSERSRSSPSEEEAAKTRKPKLRKPTQQDIDEMISNYEKHREA